jgi:hypothetical protein
MPLSIAGVIGRRLNVPVVAKSPEEAAEHFGWFAMFAGIDAPLRASGPGRFWNGGRNSPGSFPTSTGRAISKIEQGEAISNSPAP